MTCRPADVQISVHSNRECRHTQIQIQIQIHSIYLVCICIFDWFACSVCCATAVSKLSPFSSLTWFLCEKSAESWKFEKLSAIARNERNTKIPDEGASRHRAFAAGDTIPDFWVLDGGGRVLRNDNPQNPRAVLVSTRVDMDWWTAHGWTASMAGYIFIFRVYGLLLNTNIKFLTYFSMLWLWFKFKSRLVHFLFPILIIFFY